MSPPRAAALTRGRTDIGALVTFTGLCRDEGGRPSRRSTLEHYPGMAEAEIDRVASRKRSRAGRCSASPSMHRHGRIRPGERIVLVVTASSHREAAFAAAEFLMDYLKSGRPSGRKRCSPRVSKESGWAPRKKMKTL